MELKTVIKHPLDIAKDVIDESEMRLLRDMHMKAHLLNIVHKV